MWPPPVPLGFASFFWKMKPPVRDRVHFCIFCNPSRAKRRFLINRQKVTRGSSSGHFSKTSRTRAGRGVAHRIVENTSHFQIFGAFFGFSVSLARRFPRFYASHPSPLEFGAFFGLDWIGFDWIDGIGNLSLGRCFPRFYASPSSPLEFGAFFLIQFNPIQLIESNFIQSNYSNQSKPTQYILAESIHSIYVLVQVRQLHKPSVS